VFVVRKKVSTINLNC